MNLEGRVGWISIYMWLPNAAWVKTWGPPVGALLLGFFLGSVKDWLGYRNEARNVRALIRGEIECIREVGEQLVEMGKDRPVTMALELDSLVQTHVYDAYLGQLKALKNNEAEGVQKLYHWLKTEENGLVEINARIWDSGEELNQEQAAKLLSTVSQVIENSSIMVARMEYYGRPWYMRIFRKLPEGEVKLIVADEDAIDDTGGV